MHIKLIKTEFFSIFFLQKISVVGKLRISALVRRHLNKMRGQTDRRMDGRREILFNELFHVENTNFNICCLFCSQVVSLSVIMTVHGLYSDIYGFQSMHTNVVTFSLIRAIHVSFRTPQLLQAPLIHLT